MILTGNSFQRKALRWFFVVVFFVFLPVASFAAEDLDKGVYEVLGQKRTGDYRAIRKTRILRALVPYSKTFYFLDGVAQKGLAYERLMQFEKFINKNQKNKNLQINIVIIPTARDRLIPSLVEGLGDIAIGNLTITKGRLKQVAFSEAIWRNVNEIVVTGPSAPKISTIEDLSGKEVHTRKSSSYYESLVRLNKKFAAEGRPKVKITIVSEYLEDEDLLEMLNAELFEILVVDDSKALFWGEILKKITLHPEVKVNSGGEIAWAFRKKSPELKAVVDDFAKKNSEGTLFGNVVYKRYMENTSYVQNNLQSSEVKKFRAAIDLFKKYGEKYNFDYLALAALAYQESRIDQKKKSQAGAIGVMQVLPSTAKDKNVDIKNIDKIDSNIHAGAKYLRFMVDRYFNEPGLDDLNKGLFAFASYNAGPAKVAQLRKEAKQVGLNPNIWFQNVEVIAAKRVGRETVQYVSNIFKYYTAYLHIFEHKKKKVQAKYGE